MMQYLFLPGRNGPGEQEFHSCRPETKQKYSVVRKTCLTSAPFCGILQAMIWQVCFRIDWNAFELQNVGKANGVEWGMDSNKVHY